MTTIDNVTTLTASPLRVWTVLTDFAGHPQWKAFIQLSGAAVCGGDADYTFRIGGLDKAVTAKADIIRVDEPVAFAWTAGVARFLLNKALDRAAEAIEFLYYDAIAGTREAQGFQ